jgi:hypothetical protein
MPRIVAEAIEYLHAVSKQIDDTYPGDCRKHAEELAKLLRHEGRQPWIGRLRKTTELNGSTLHHPLIALRFRGRGLRAIPAWTTHYVCCCDGLAYDPLLGEPVPIESYSERAFGEQLPMARSPES